MTAPAKKTAGIGGSVSSLAAAIKNKAQGEIRELPLDLIDTKDQVRTEFNPASLEELAAEMKTPRRNTIPAILVRPGQVPGRFLVVFGERRLRAARLAELPTIRAEVREMTDDEADDIQFAENIQREDLPMMDEARAIRKRYDKHKAAGVSAAVDKIAGEVNKSKGWVSKRLAMSDPKVHAHVQQLMVDGVTEDFELLGALSKVYDIDWNEGYRLFDLVTQGKADRATVRDRLAELKAGKKAAEASKPAPKKKTPAAPKSALFTLSAAASELYAALFDPAEDAPASPRGVAGAYLAQLKDDERAQIEALFVGFHQRGPQIAAQGPVGMIRAITSSLANDAWDPDAATLALGGYTFEPFALGALLMGAAGLPFSLEALIDAVTPADLATQGE